MKKIIIPTDFSHCASVAINFAVQSAKVIPAQILLVHVFELKANMHTDYLGVNKVFNQTLLNNAKDKMNFLQQAIFQKDSIEVETLVITGSFEKKILHLIIEKKIDFMVMGTSGASGMKVLSVQFNHTCL